MSGLTLGLLGMDLLYLDVLSKGALSLAIDGITLIPLFVRWRALHAEVRN